MEALYECGLMCTEKKIYACCQLSINFYEIR